MRRSIFLKKYWTVPRQTQFLKHFSQLLHNGYSTNTALEVLSVLFKQSEIQHIQTSCANGDKFSTILGHLNFEHRALYLISCSEEAGAMLNGLQKATEFLKFSSTQRQELLKKVSYPLQLFFGVLFVVGAIFLIFVPQIDSFYANLNIEGDQRFLTLILGLIATILLTVLLFSSVIYLILHIKSVKFQQKAISILFKLPLIQKVMSYYFSSQWLLFLNCGLSLRETLHMMNQFETLPMLKLILIELIEKLENGYPLEDLFQVCPYFSPYFKLVVSHGLSCGAIEVELSQYQEFEFNYLTQILSKFFKSIQLMLLLLIGILIILIYLSILQPVFDMIQLF